MKVQQQPLYILSVDGGGIRGLIAAAFLAGLEKDLSMTLYNKFSMFAGTSIGSFLALLISAKQATGEDIVNLFNKKNINKIFDKRFLSFLSAFHGPKYKGDGKRKLLQQIFGEQKFSTLKKQTLITAYDIVTNCAVIFKSLNKDSKDMRCNPTIAEVADASSAAPTYFPTVAVGCDPIRWLIDGGISANDPALCILVEALQMGYTLDSIKILSLGTGLTNVMPQEDIGKNSQHWGGLGWLQHGIIEDLFSGNVSVTEYHLKELLKGNYFRVDEKLHGASMQLDDITPDNLQALITTGQHWYKNNRDKLLSWLNEVPPSE